MFFILFGIFYLLIYSLDRYYFNILNGIILREGLDPNLTRRLGYYNETMFKSYLGPIILSLSLSLLAYLGHLFILRRRKKDLEGSIKSLEDDLTRINKGDYLLKLDYDEFSSLRDEIYKIVVSLQSLEEESRKDRLNLKNDLSNIAHQLKTPLTSIGFMVDLIDEDPENSKTYLARLKKELGRLNEFTEILLKLSRINSRTIDYKMEDLDLGEIFQDILNKLDPESRIEVEFIGENMTVKGDDIWLYEGFLNIVKNSLAYTKDKLVIEFGSNPIYKEVFIRDQGPGLGEDKIDRIFDRFYQGERGRSGYGIGLNLSKTIIKNHMGDIRAYNEDGLTFHIKFYNVT